MKASLISIGNELLSGRTVDTNAAHLAAELLTLGVPVVSGYTVGDEKDAIVRMLGLACEDADLILITGGLGPTADDITRDAVARFLGVDLQFQPGLFEEISRFFESRGRKMAETNKVQAYLPAGAKALSNSCGTAPGFQVLHDGRLMIAMPGVPSEMHRMFAESVVPQVREMAADQCIEVRKLQCYGTGESNIAEMLGPLMMRGRNPLINSTASAGVITLHIIAAAESQAQAASMADEDERKLRDKLGPVVFGVDDERLAQVVGKMLVARSMTLSIAESCTGGLLAKLLTDESGASDYFKQSWVTYTNESKVRELAVPAELIDACGAVSSEVAEAMARGALKNADADCAIAITGIAGPTGDTPEKPLGLVYIALAFDGRIYSKRCVFPQPRYAVRLRSALTALNMLRLELSG